MNQKNANLTKRVGLLIPSSNTVMEVDFYRHLPDSVTVHTGRMYMESTTVQGEGEMLDVYAIQTAEVLAKEGDKVLGGLTPMVRWPRAEPRTNGHAVAAAGTAG